MSRGLLPDAIVLNGASSSGKSNIGKLLQERLPQVFLNFSIDAILYALPPSDLARMITGERIVRDGYRYDKLVLGYHAAAAALLAIGNRLILDNAITKREWRLDLERRLQGHRSVWVGVFCDDWQLAKRERERGDRAPGTAEREAAVVHDGMRYDVTVDTTSCSPDEAATAVLNALNLHFVH